MIVNVMIFVCDYNGKVWNREWLYVECIRYDGVFIVKFIVG